MVETVQDRHFRWPLEQLDQLSGNIRCMSPMHARETVVYSIQGLLNAANEMQSSRNRFLLVAEMVDSTPRIPLVACKLVAEYESLLLIIVTCGRRDFIKPCCC